jgi:hypothetical protein
MAYESQGKLEVVDKAARKGEHMLEEAPSRIVVVAITITKNTEPARGRGSIRDLRLHELV